MALKITGIGIVVIFFLTIGVFAYFRKDLPKIKDISGDRLGGSITYYDRTGQTVLWQDYNAVKRIPVEGDNISNNMKQATVAVEDKNFYKHGAFDMRGIVRAGMYDVFGAGGTLQGGSTITQQLVKLNQDWTNNRTITRKVKELILAVELEREYSKQDILTGYLNIAPYGGIEYGIETAARDYFHTDAKSLTLPQAAMLAAIPKSPAYYSPYSDTFDKDALVGRQHYILDQMVDQGMISKQQAEDAKKVDILSQIYPLQAKYQGIKAPYFVLAAKAQLEKKYGAATVQRGGWKVITSLDMNLQNLAEKQVNDDMWRVQRNGGDNAAFVAEDVQTGQVVALVGGVDFTNPDFGQINYAQTPIPPGSSFKPYDYATLINETGAGAGSVLYDSQGPLPGYPCTNKNNPKYDKRDPAEGGPNCLWDYDFRYPGPLTLRYALGGSRNIPAVKAMLTVGTDKVIKTAESMQSDGKGFGYNCYADTALTKTTQCYGASAIGDGAFLHLDEHVNGLATLSRLGKFVPQTYIMEIQNASGKTIEKWTQAKTDANSKQVIKPGAAYIVNDMLSDPKASYLNYSYKFQQQKNGWHFAVKTGTTNDNYDGLMTSWSTKYAVATWVGYHTRNKAMTAGSMETMTEPIVRGWMEAAHSSLPAVNWKMPSDVKTQPAFVVRAHVGVGSIEPSPSTDIFPAWNKPKSGNASQTIDKVSGKLATSCTPEAAKQIVGNANANTFSVDKFVSGGSAASYAISGNDDVHNCNDSRPTVVISAPPVCDANEGGCVITATATQGTHPLGGSQYGGTLTIKVNGSDVQSFSVSDSPSTASFTYIPSSSGSMNVSATVVDSVLYDATSDPVTVNMVAAATPPQTTPPPTTQNGGTPGTNGTTGGSPSRPNG
mgnify:CR=1 FL=1